MGRPMENQGFTSVQREFLRCLRQQGKSINTIKNYRTDILCFNRYLRDNLSGLELEHFNGQRAQEYGQYITQRYNSDNSRRRRIQSLRIFFDFLVNKKIYGENPVRKISPSPKFVDIPRPTPFPDVQKLWNHLIQNGRRGGPMEQLTAARNQVLFMLIYSSGLKVSDLARLKSHHIHNIAGQPQVVVTPPRPPPYNVSIHPAFDTIYRNYRELLAQCKSRSGVEFDHLFFSGNPFKILRGGLSPRGLEGIFEELRKNLLIQVTAKSLRQAAIFNWLGQNHSENQIKQWLGVAPSYSLRPYRERIGQHPYNDDFFHYTLEKTLH